MATSGTYTFLVTRDSIINAALRLIKAIPERDIAVGARLNNCAQALNIMVKAWVMEGLPLWAVQEVTIAMIAGQSQYNVGPVTSNPRPLRILDAYIRNNTTLQDVSLAVLSRYDYDMLGSKTTQGVPNQVWYDPQLTNGIVTFYNVPQDTSYTVHLVIQRQFQDFNLATDNPDFPQEAYQALKWNLADELYPEYGDLTNKELQMLVSQKAKFFLDKLSDFWQEYAPVQFTPSERKM